MEQPEIAEQPEAEAEEQEATSGQQDTQPSEPSPGSESLAPAEPEGGYRFKEGELIADRYRVVAPLGFGGFSQVYRCKDVRLGHDVAIKVLNEKEVGLQEARAAVKLRHANIVRVSDTFELKDGTSIILFDYVAGQTLEAHLVQAQDRRFPLDPDTLQIIRQVADALDYAHSQNVIHRDIKPSNIILDQQNSAYLTDFGLAEVKRPADGRSALTTEVQRQLSGTIPYMAPEQIREGTPGDARGDLYSLGVVVYRILTGVLPYPEPDTGFLMFKIVAAEPIPPTQANPDLPWGVESVLLRAIDKDPDKRPPSCLVFADELEKAARAYVEAGAQYAQAKELFESKRWRQALAAFESLEVQAKGFKDTAHYLEQTRNQVRFLELYEQAQGLLEQGEYQAALDTLNNLTQLDPEYDVADLRQQARENLAREKKETLDAQYRQAVRQFKNQEYEACLDTLAVIYEQDADYSDPEEIVQPARAQAERQRRLRELYNRGVKQMGQEQWEEAVAAFQELQEEEPGYEDVENQLASARLLAKVSLPLQEARELLKQEKFVACVDKLQELGQIDPDYKRDEVERLRQEALNLLYRRATGLLEGGKFKDSLTALTALEQRSPDYPGVEELEAQAREGIRIQDLRAKLDGLYQRAVEHLNRREHAQALELWQEIQQQQEDLEYPDERNVESLAKSGLCMQLYNQALAALTQEDFDRALGSWQQVCEVDPTYPDSQRVEQQARAMQLYRQSLDALTQGDPQRALELLRQARDANPNHPDKQRVEQQARSMMLYSQAQQALNRGDTRQALELLSQTRQVDPNYPDDQHVEQRAQAMTLYGQASDALTQEEYRRALELLQQVRTIDPHYPDKHQVEQQAQAVLDERERAEKLRRWGLYIGVGAAALICLAIIVALAGSPYLPWARPTPTATPTLTPSPSPTLTPSLTSTTPPPTDTPSPSPTSEPTSAPDTHATATQGAGIFVAPDADSQTVGGVAEGEQVRVLGRSQYGNWFYVRDDQGVEGFTYVPRYEWSGDYEALPIVPSTITPVPVTPPPPGTPHPLLTIDLWHLPWTADCKAEWTMSVFIAGHGGNGVYTYYWDDQVVAGPLTNEGHTFEVHGSGSTLIGTGRVVSGDGQVAEKALLIPAPCP